MKKLESTLVSIVIAILCPFLLFVASWWFTAGLTIFHVFSIPEIGIAVAAGAGLLLGITFDILFLRKWVSRFYTVDLRVMALVYIGSSFIAVAFLMGLPFANVALGTLAGVYIGRRLFHSAGSAKQYALAVRNTALFTAVVTGVEALAIGLLALNEDWVVAWLQKITRVKTAAVVGLWGVGLVLLLCAVLATLQFWLTKITAKLAYGYRINGSCPSSKA